MLNKAQMEILRELQEIQYVLSNSNLIELDISKSRDYISARCYYFTYKGISFTPVGITIYLYDFYSEERLKKNFQNFKQRLKYQLGVVV